MYGTPSWGKTVHNMTSSFLFLLLNGNALLQELGLPSQRPQHILIELEGAWIEDVKGNMHVSSFEIATTQP